MISPDKMAKQLKDSNLAAVARACGLSYETVRSIAQGKAENVRYSSVLKVAKYLEGKTNV